MKKVIKFFLVIVIVGIIGIGGYLFKEYSYSIKDDEIDINEKINYVDMINSGEVKNRDYSSSVFYPYFELLNDNQKQVYNELVDGINNYSEYIVPSVSITLDEVKDTFYAVLYEHPELFWLDNNYSCEHYEEDMIVTKVFLKYTDLVNNIDEEKKRFYDVIDNIVNDANKYELDYAKEKYVHDTLIHHIEYTKETENHQSAYDALVNKKAVCAGYTKAFQIIMNKLGIPTYYITGFSNEDHAWNLIELEDGFYNIEGQDFKVSDKLNGKITAAIRAEKMTTGTKSIYVKPEIVELTGGEKSVYFTLNGCKCSARIPADYPCVDKLELKISEKDMYFFDYDLGDVITL